MDKLKIGDMIIFTSFWEGMAYNKEVLKTLSGYDKGMGHPTYIDTSNKAVVVDIKKIKKDKIAKYYQLFLFKDKNLNFLEYYVRIGNGCPCIKKIGGDLK